MKLTQKDFEERVARLAAGVGDDEDRRLVKLYVREGYHEGVIAKAQPVDEPAEQKPINSRRQRLKSL